MSAGWMLVAGLLPTGGTGWSAVAKGTGTITLELNAQPGFASGSKTKAVDELRIKIRMDIRCRSFLVIILKMSSCLRIGCSIDWRRVRIS